MRVLVTGITGFVGSHLAEYLLTRDGVEVFGLLRWRSDTSNIDPIMTKLKLIECDLRDAFSVEKALRSIKPRKIFHLASQSFVPASWNAPLETMMTNVMGQVNLLEAVRKMEWDCWIQIAGTSEEYGSVQPEESPIRETNPFRPLSPYAVSKVTQDLLGYQYHRSFKMNIVTTRAFNHTGPRRGERFMTSSFSKQIALIEKGKIPPVVKVGNLEPRRDFTDVRDVVQAYWLATERCEAGKAYNVCSGKAYSAKETLDLLLAMTKASIKIEEDPARLRPSDVKLLVGDNTKFTQATGWRPTIPFEKTLEDLLNYWRQKV